MIALPQLPIPSRPVAVYRGLEIDQMHVLDEALAGVPLGAYEQRITKWLKQTGHSHHREHHPPRPPASNRARR